MYFYIYSIYVYICGIINITVHVYFIFHSVDAVEMQFEKGNYVRAWTDDKKTIQYNKKK